MAHMDIHFGFSVNGVAALHTEILKTSELKPFYDRYPEKFRNETNGITFRRWLMGCNPELASLLTDAIGSGWTRDAARLEDLLSLRGDADFVQRLLEVKEGNKGRLAAWLSAEKNVEVDPHSIFDIQVKRMHQYKRQQMNALYAIWKYLQIKRGNVPDRPLTMVFGAKAAPAYTLAKDTIALLLALGRLIAEGRSRSPRGFASSSWRTTTSRQPSTSFPPRTSPSRFSLASKEASGTSNMKFMANGALTLGTLDGANVEIAELVGRENIYLFGRSSEDVIGLYDRGDYRPWDVWQADGELAEVLDFICSPELLARGDAGCITRVYRDFVAKDYFMALLDARDYVTVKERCLADYEDRASWGEKVLVNVAKSGFFSSDRTIREYDRDIWHLS